LENDIKAYDKIDPKNKAKDGMEFMKEDEEANKKAIKKAIGKYQDHMKPLLQSFVPNAVEDPL
jgi:hypothetical protein